MKRILLAEDDLSLIGGLSFVLKKEGYKAEVARTSLEADALWQDGKYDLVILDVAFPDGFGFELCRKMRRASKVPQPGGPGTPFPWHPGRTGKRGSV